MTLAWITLAVLGGIAFLIGLLRFARTMWPDPDHESLAITPLEFLGWVGLAVTTIVGLTLGVLAAVNGVEGFSDSGTARGIFFVVLMAGIGAWYVAWRIVRRRDGRAVIDERDRDIQARSFTVESMMVILSLVAWTVSLTEIYWDDGVLPLGYLQLIFWSTFVAGAFGRAAGIVLGYRRRPMVDA